MIADLSSETGGMPRIASALAFQCNHPGAGRSRFPNCWSFGNSRRYWVQSRLTGSTLSPTSRTLVTPPESLPSNFPEPDFGGISPVAGRRASTRSTTQPRTPSMLPGLGRNRYLESSAGYCQFPLVGGDFRPDGVGKLSRSEWPTHTPRIAARSDTNRRMLYLVQSGVAKARMKQDMGTPALGCLIRRSQSASLLELLNACNRRSG
jgi:hypothetical protein